MDRKYTSRTEQDGDGHDGSRTLYDTGDDRTYQKECDDGKMALVSKELKKSMTEGLCSRSRSFPAALKRTSEEKESYTKKEIAEIAFLLAID